MNKFLLQNNFSTAQLLSWSASFPYVTFLNSNVEEQLYKDPYSSFDWLLAVGSEKLNLQNVFPELASERKNSRGWITGYFGYDLKNQLENLYSLNPDTQNADESFFFKPSLIIDKKGDSIFIEGCSSEQHAAEIANEISNCSPALKSADTKPTLKCRVSKEEYISNAKAIMDHIQRGDIYEMNYCIEFFADHFTADPQSLYRSLNELSPMPFSAFLRSDDHYVICASPERFIAKRGSKIISQPIKGTAKRGKTKTEDEQLKKDLFESEKERSENVMIVDLVRNDLSRTANKGTVRVEELCGVKTFRRLHQMISTVVSEVPESLEAEVIAKAFPMGSMTGAPKVRAMELIEQFENTRRGIYSGAIGYFSPEGNFDFNVVIRSILYNHKKNIVSFNVGSAITINSNPDSEYDECLLKAESMMQILSQ
jgi:para-aminobenzoate synthetase component I